MKKTINDKDVHVVAAAQAVNAQFLLALDKGLVFEVNRANIGLQAFTPGDFIKLILPTHIQYPPDRD